MVENSITLVSAVVGNSQKILKEIQLHSQVFLDFKKNLNLNASLWLNRFKVYRNFVVVFFTFGF